MKHAKKRSICYVGFLIVLFSGFSILEAKSDEDMYKEGKKIYEERLKKLNGLVEKGLLDENLVPLNKEGCEEYKKIFNYDLSCDELIKRAKKWAEKRNEKQQEEDELKALGLLNKYSSPTPKTKKDYEILIEKGYFSKDFNIDADIERKQQDKKVSEILEKDHTYKSVRNLKKASKELKILIKKEPRSSWNYVNLGLLYFRMSMFDRDGRKSKKYQSLAEEYWAKAIELEPRQKELVDMKKRSIYRTADNFVDIEKRQRQEEARKYSSEGDKHMLYGINLSSSAKYYNAAVECFNKAIELDPDSPGGYISLGIAYDKLEKYSEAVAEFNKALKRSAEAEDINRIRIFLAEEYKKLDKLKKAEKEYQKILKQDPNNYAAKEGLKKLKVQ